MPLSQKTALKLAPATIDRLRVLTRRQNYENNENQNWCQVGRALLDHALDQFAQRTSEEPTQQEKKLGASK